MWVLVIVILSGSVRSTSITNIPGFSSEEMCTSAGRKWSHEQPVARVESFTVCVKTQ